MIFCCSHSESTFSVPGSAIFLFSSARGLQSCHDVGMSILIPGFSLDPAGSYLFVRHFWRLFTGTFEILGKCQRIPRFSLVCPMISESGASSGFRDFDVAGFVNNIASAFASVPLLSSVCSWCPQNGESRIIVCDALVCSICCWDEYRRRNWLSVNRECLRPIESKASFT